MRLALACSIVGLMTAGCGPLVRMEVSGLSDGTTLQDKTYYLVPADKNASLADLQFVEASIYVNRALKERGYREVSPNVARLAVFLAYGISGPKRQATVHSSPEYGFVGGGIGSFQSQTMGGGTSYATTGTVQMQPEYGVVGHSVDTTIETTYDRYLYLAAYDAGTISAVGVQPKQRWVVGATSSGTNGDIRRLLPIMVGGAYDYIGSNTGRQVKIMLTEGDKRVKLVKGLAP